MLNENLDLTTAEIKQYFTNKLNAETDCSDVYAAIKAGTNQFVLVDVRAPQAFTKSHAVGAINLPHSQITSEHMQQFSLDTQFIVYCWGPGCNGATKAALKLATLGYQVKEMLGGIQYWEDFERYPVIRKLDQEQQ